MFLERKNKHELQNVRNVSGEYELYDVQLFCDL